MAEDAGHTSVVPVERPLNLIPVGLKEAALDSPTFRATSLHFADQVEVIERWLDGYVKAAAKLMADISTLESTVNALITASAPPAQISEAVLDHDYTLLAIKRYGEGARDFWNQTFRGVKKHDSTVIEPIRSFMNNDLRVFKEARRTLEANQRNFDGVIARYSAQNKTKEASSLREDAFQLHEARKAYLKASMDFCITAPQLRASLDQLVVRIFHDQWKAMRSSRDGSASTLTKLNGEMERIRGWSREMENSERAFKRELMTARRQIEESASNMTKPSRELGAYEISALPYSGTGASTATGLATKTGTVEHGEKQGWLYLKTLVGKPTRTVWSRRWFFVKSGIFGWLVQGSRSGGVEESEKTGVLLCGVRPASQEERRFCFEVKTTDTSIILQAETQAELSEWISTFEFAKRKALEDPGSTENLSSSGVHPAFAISPPSAPEFAARMGDGEQRGDEPTGGLSIPEREGTNLSLQQRNSFDVNMTRRVMSLERDPGESTRERVLQKLDLHKRTTTAQAAQAPLPAGGIASLISASHNVLPISPGTPQGADVFSSPKRNLTPTFSTLAPSALANPPAPTNLSHTAVVVSGERGVGLATKADGSGMPSGIMANLWGSSNWGYVNRLVDEAPRAEPHQRSSSQPPSPPQVLTRSIDDVGVIDGTGELSKDLAPLIADSSPGHRKAASMAAMTDTNLPEQLAKAAAEKEDEWPNYYPLPLKAQYAQFRMLFPSVPRAEKIVLVFRATWNPNEQQEFPGRIYATTKDIYFYSHHLGLVLINGISLSSINEVTAAPGRDCDFLYLHLKEDQTYSDRRRITIKVFLETLRLLQRRLNFLVHNANSDEPVSLEEVLKTLIKMEVEKPKRSSSVESWEEIAYDGDDAVAGDDGSPERRRERNVKASLRIDGTLYGEPAKTGRDVQKFQLPRQPVVYAPQGMHNSVTREFEVSAKALFHVIFGDKSAVFQLLYCNRWGDKIVQTPWVKSDGGHWTRQFASEGKVTPMADTQTVDIFNDHLCYVVTNAKYPWRLPYADRFHLTTKLVITHVAKSRSKLAVFQQISWYKAPSMPYYQQLIEKQALNNLEADALDLTNVAMDQVAKLGKFSKTEKAIEIFGNIGQQNVVPQIDANAVNLGGTVASRARQTKPVSLVKLVVSDVMVKVVRSTSLAFDITIALGKGLLGLCTAHTLLVALLIFSALYNSWHGYRDGLVWWHERSASNYMARLGVKPEPMIGKAVYLADIEEMVKPTVDRDSVISFVPSVEDYTKTCRTTFGEQLTISTPLTGAGARLHRSRDALARYRHDLLVALKVVNRVERDIVLGEWEDWVRAEERKCERIERMLLHRRQEGKKDRKGKSLPPVEDLDSELGPDFAAYCASCRDELVLIGNGTSLI